MTHQSEPELLVLHSLRLKGFAEPPDVADATALPEPTVREILGSFRDQDLVGRRDGRICGFLLTESGKSHHARMLETERSASGCHAIVESTYATFLAQNETFKQLCSDWQLRIVNGTQVPNDHSDAAYDAAIGDRLAGLQVEVAPLIDAVAGVLGRFE